VRSNSSSEEKPVRTAAVVSGENGDVSEAVSRGDVSLTRPKVDRRGRLGGRVRVGRSKADREGPVSQGQPEGNRLSGSGDAVSKPDGGEPVPAEPLKVNPQNVPGAGGAGDGQTLPGVVAAVAQSKEFVRRFKKRAWFEQVCDAAQAFVAAGAVRHFMSRNCWLVCPDARRQVEVFNGLLNWGITAWFFPELEAPAIEGAVADPEVVAERLNVLQRLAEGKRAVVVLTKAALEDEVPNREKVGSQTVVVKRGQLLERAQLVESLLKCGYQQVGQVSGRGEFAVRGGIVDIFSLQHALPLRIELFGNEIDSLREFDLDDQTAIQVVERGEIFLGQPESEGTRLEHYIQSGDVLIDIEAGQEEAQVRISSGALDTEATEDFETAFYPSGFHNFEAGDFLVEETKREQALEQIRRWLTEGWRVLAVCHNEGELERLRDVFTDNEVDVERIVFAVGVLNHGFTYETGKLAVLSDAEIFGRYQSPSARRLALRRSRLRGGRAPVDFSELAEGDFVVHLEYGIAKYNGIRQLEQDGTETECVVLEFADDAKLYVPFEQAFLISRYVGLGKRFPPLSTLGDSKWSKAKKAAETAVFDYAGRLLKLQAERQTLTGHKFLPDTKWQAEFEASFLYKETPDQLRAIDDTKRDMESEQPMDRLICGDVGFGKTEVAIRAAFKVVMGGKQVAMLVPTTVLAQQHFKTLRERTSDYPVTVGMLSRFLSPGEQRKTIEAIRDGSLDMVIGTHRLVSPDIEFKDLGLVIVDEEQRFGVRHKERLKERFKLVDVLTLSATPIPRTLYLSLVGAKDMSVIETPPPNRLPVETIVCAYDERVIRDAIQREVKRRGQVYFLHNRVHSIQHVKQRVLELCPGARVGVGHGQMDEDELEQVMRRFVDGEIDVLISTIIIESGLDIPNANTIIIDRADRFGLADLYQLRGRVGRAQHKAYAYLMLPRELMGVGAARRRINAIKQYSGLGAGFKIAMRDLEIRGAGNILGTAQSGHITNVGFELYCHLLHEAIDKLKGKKSKARTETLVRLDFVATNESEFVSEGETKTPAFISADYIPQPHLRIQAYKKLAAATNAEELSKLQKEWRDRFGPLPVAVSNLLLLNETKLMAAKARVVRVEVKETKVMLLRGGDYLLIGDRFPRLTSPDLQSRLAELFSLLKKLSD
jgi:transcription-repair coupling factor (superfamily II helicase)